MMNLLSMRGKKPQWKDNGMAEVTEQKQEIL